MRRYSAAPAPSALARILRSSIGSKFLMAVTGLLLLLFVIGHLLGNLQLLRGPEAMNAYAHWLHTHPGLLWTARIGLLVVFVLHIWTAIRLDLENRAARPDRYRFRAVVQASFASRTMLVSGLLVLAYVVYHLLHFTFHTIDTGAMGVVDRLGRRDVHAMVVSGFSNPGVAISYIVANLLLGLHLWHAIGSAWQTLGWTHPVFRPLGRLLAVALPILITAGYVLLPISVWSGLVS